jgi:Na+-transporting NADH:ubiquinone oxidoreductase subunit NqrC
MENKFSKNIVIATMTFVGILLLVSTIINSSSNMSVDAQQQSPKQKHQKKVLSLFSMKRVGQQTSRKNVLPWPV